MPNLVPEPVRSTSCGMVRGPTSLISEPLEVSLCTHREYIELCYVVCARWVIKDTIQKIKLKEYGYNTEEVSFC